MRAVPVVLVAAALKAVEAVAERLALAESAVPAVLELRVLRRVPGAAVMAEELRAYLLRVRQPARAEITVSAVAVDLWVVGVVPMAVVAAAQPQRAPSAGMADEEVISTSASCLLVAVAAAAAVWALAVAAAVSSAAEAAVLAPMELEPKEGLVCA